MSEEKYKKAARVLVKAGAFPFPINDTLIKILKLSVDERDLDFIIAFKKRTSQTMDQLKLSSRMSEEAILEHVERLAKVGLIFNQPSSKGIMVYRLMPIVVIGLFEYLFMKKLEYNEKEKKLAQLFSKLFSELTNFVQNGYDTIVPIFHRMPPLDRTVAILDKSVQGEEIEIIINQNVDVPEEQVLLTQKLEDIIEKFDDIAVGHCFCRNHQDILGNSCKQTDLRENCFTFGKSARYCAEQGFARLISKEEAFNILKQSEEDGLVHKAWHPHSDITKEETSVCNCCKDCCATFEWWKTGMAALINYTNYLSNINQNLCTGCGICIEKCSVDAIQLNDDNIAQVNENYCIGCGVCAHFCPEGAILLLEGIRKIYIPPPRLRN